MQLQGIQMILKAKFKLSLDDMRLKISGFRFKEFIVSKTIEDKKCIVIGEQLDIMHLIGHLAVDQMSILEAVTEVI